LQKIGISPTNSDSVGMMPEHNTSTRLLPSEVRSSGLLPDWSILQEREDLDQCEETIDIDYIV
ncbi:hypothetical protein BY996DRAFT_6526077, partial [Phakopsora pachyrhizi]